jgi:hypothetical protein
MNPGMDYETQTGADLAPQACASCRKQKRKCDKQLPTCSLCQRIGRQCDYSADTHNPAPSPEEFAALREQVANLEQLLRSNVSGNSSVTSNSSNGTDPTLLSLTASNGNGSNGINGSNGSTPSNFNLYSPGHIPVWPGASSFPSLFFLDSNAYEYERFQIQAPYVKVPPGALTALGSSQQLREMIEEYFATVHTYFPMISKIRLYQHLANPLHEPGADIALLFLAMKLACSEIPEGMPPQTQLYQDVKSFYNYIESQNGFSIQMMQALLLIALYETGHSIYPAAYLSIGNASRLGYAMGLHNRKAPQMLPRCNTWTEQEERRRVWWAILILDRFINIGHRSKPLSTTDPSIDMHLPTEDTAWDRGQMLVAAPMSLSTTQTVRVAPFARCCQAAHLLGKTLRHLDDRDVPDEYRFDDALQLHRTMMALADVLPDEASTDDEVRPALCSSMAILYSALLTLYDAHSCTDRSTEQHCEAQLVVQKECIDGLSEVSSRVVGLARRIRNVIETKGFGHCNPLVIDSIYQSAANCKSPSI